MIEPVIRDLDKSIEKLLRQGAPPGSALRQAQISFDVPDTDWRLRLEDQTVNCYLYDIRENRGLRTQEPLTQRIDSSHAVRRRPPVRIDCAYCITAWSPAEAESVLEEHALLSEVLTVLIRHSTLPQAFLVGSLASQIPPLPTVVAAPDGVKNPPEFWGALNQQLKPSLNYVVTLALMVDEVPDLVPHITEEVSVTVDHLEESSG